METEFASGISAMCTFGDLRNYEAFWSLIPYLSVFLTGKPTLILHEIFTDLLGFLLYKLGQCRRQVIALFGCSSTFTVYLVLVALTAIHPLLAVTYGSILLSFTMLGAFPIFLWSASWSAWWVLFCMLWHFYRLSSTSFINETSVYIDFHEGGRGQQMAAKWGSWRTVGGFEPNDLHVQMPRSFPFYHHRSC